MAANKEILQRIADSMDAEEFIDRLGVNMYQVVAKFAKEVFEDLERFDDIYEGEEDEG